MIKTLILKFTKSPVGGRVYSAAIQPLVRLGRRMANPSLPVDRVMAQYTVNGRQVSMLLRRHTSDQMACEQCFTHEQYDFPTGVHGDLTERRYREILAAGSRPLIVDCGANIGASVVWFATRYPEAHIIAVEPAPANFEILQVNTGGFDVDLRMAGVGAENGISALDDSDGEGMGYRTNAEAAGPSIEIISIASLLDGGASENLVPFLLKVDIEGAEKGLFDGDCSAISRFPLIMLEPHDWLIPGERTSVPFFRFHAAAEREFCMRDENVASITQDDSIVGVVEGRRNWYHGEYD